MATNPTKLTGIGSTASQIQTAPNLVAFDPKLAVPSQQIYLQRNDQLFLAFLTNATNVKARVNYRWLTPDGEIKEGEFDTAAFGGNASFTIPLYEGWLLSFSAIMVSSSLPYTWLYLQAFISRTPNPTLSGPLQALIWQGYIPNPSQNGWPGMPAKEITDGIGILRSITGTAPAAGAEINEIAPASTRWIVLAFRTVLTTSAAVANRETSLAIDDGVNTFSKYPSGFTQAASLTRAVTFAPGTSRYDGAQANETVAPIAPVGIKGAMRLRTVTQNLQAGDQYLAPQYVVQEWGSWT